MKYRPSSLPMLGVCPKWQSSGGNSDTNAGTVRHIALGKALSADPDPLAGLPDDEAERVQWAADYIQCKADTQANTLHIERKLSLLDDDFNVITEGTPDIVCGNKIFDLKWRERDYTSQMAAYSAALKQAEEFDSVEVHLLFAERKHAHVITFNGEEDLKIVKTVIRWAESEASGPVPCEYCGWCALRATCKAHRERAELIARNRGDMKTLLENEKLAAWLANGAHTSEINDGETAGLVLQLARGLAEFCEGAEHHCKELAIKQGIVPAGFKLQERKGARVIPSVTDAYARAGLPQDEFLAACEVKFAALAETFAKVNGVKKAQAERTVEEKLGDAIQRKSASISLVTEK